eukprot:gnl/Chilomastix_cuspidata/926.p1 GENE.gnl/Chilomastix_cuspidata/926~~gnl/Chilomastix_cuspidata/926.p1  ORF type:complete len:691 (+),score=328.28 gnl/Chilomastix_cuspidata/926:1190-3262(+)
MEAHSSALEMARALAALGWTATHLAQVSGLVHNDALNILFAHGNPEKLLEPDVFYAVLDHPLINPSVAVAPVDVTKAERPEFFCGECGRFLTLPITLSPCGHTVCSACLVTHRGARECPLCKDKIETEAIASALAAELAQAVVACPFCCNEGDAASAPHPRWTGNLSALADHLTVCPSAPVPCRFAFLGCDEQPPRRLWDAHVAECEFHLVECEHCHGSFPARDQRRHEEACPQLPVECPHACGATLPRAGLATHAQVCPKFLRPCPIRGCGEVFPNDGIQAHLADPAFLGAHLLLLTRHADKAVPAPRDDSTTLTRYNVNEHIAAFNALVRGFAVRANTSVSHLRRDVQPLADLSEELRTDAHPLVAVARSKLVADDQPARTARLSSGVVDATASVRGLRAAQDSVESVKNTFSSEAAQAAIPITAERAREIAAAEVEAHAAEILAPFAEEMFLRFASTADKETRRQIERIDGALAEAHGSVDGALADFDSERAAWGELIAAYLRDKRIDKSDAAEEAERMTEELARSCAEKEARAAALRLYLDDLLARNDERRAALAVLEERHRRLEATLREASVRRELLEDWWAAEPRSLDVFCAERSKIKLKVDDDARTGAVKILARNVLGEPIEAFDVASLHSELALTAAEPGVEPVPVELSTDTLAFALPPVPRAALTLTLRGCSVAEISLPCE